VKAFLYLHLIRVDKGKECALFAWFRSYASVGYGRGRVFGIYGMRRVRFGEEDGVWIWTLHYCKNE